MDSTSQRSAAERTDGRTDAPHRNLAVINKGREPFGLVFLNYALPLNPAPAARTHLPPVTSLPPPCPRSHPLLLPPLLCLCGSKQKPTPGQSWQVRERRARRLALLEAALGPTRSRPEEQGEQEAAASGLRAVAAGALEIWATEALQ
ncbi:hypothetical protein ZWY2020_038731 [Hordeum vulgare]|nr:hypothetical protein ZWY2020_038731 [Hordeum vulgare]